MRKVFLLPLQLLFRRKDSYCVWLHQLLPRFYQVLLVSTSKNNILYCLSKLNLWSHSLKDNHLKPLRRNLWHVYSRLILWATPSWIAHGREPAMRMIPEDAAECLFVKKKQRWRPNNQVTPKYFEQILRTLIASKLLKCHPKRKRAKGRKRRRRMVR